MSKSADGLVLTVKAKCPDIVAASLPFHQNSEGDYVEGAITDLIDESDE